MATLSLRLPESVHDKLTKLARAEGVSLNQLLCSAAAEKLAALMTEEYLAERASRGSKAKFKAVLAKVPNASPVVGDEVPKAPRKPSRKTG